MSNKPYCFTTEQLAIIIRGSIGIANEFYAAGKSDQEVFKMTIATQIEGLMVERELVNRGELAKAEYQIYEARQNS